MPNTLNEIVDFLKNSDFKLSKNLSDGRINSAVNEDEIFNIIASKFKVNRPNVRDWVDFSFDENGGFYPVNIKISTTKTADNLNCKLGIYYALTGKNPPFGNEVVWERYFKELSRNLEPNSKDYYFLIINKDDFGDVFATSLKSLCKIVATGNNLPFQAKWDENRTLQSRTFEEAKNFLLSTFARSLELRANAYLSFKQYFGEFCNGR